MTCFTIQAATGPGVCVDPREQFTWGHSAVSPPVRAEPAGGLLQNPRGGSCSPWSLSTALGTWAACECVRAGGMEDTVAVKGVF